MTALQPGATVWAQVPGVEEVFHADTIDAELPAPAANLRTVIIPLLEDHIASCPTAYKSLTPSKQALLILGNKAEFAAYARANGLAHLCPETYANPDTAVYPCMIKRVDLNCGVGVRLVHSKNELRACQEQEPWRGHSHLLQAYVGGDRQSATHCICKDGRIVWHCAYVYEPADSNTVCNRGRRIHRTTEPASRLAEFESFLAPLSYSGPCNVDYKISADDDRTMIMEINPRFGGSLMRPDNLSDLVAALSWILTLSAGL